MYYLDVSMLIITAVWCMLLTWFTLFLITKTTFLMGTQSKYRRGKVDLNRCMQRPYIRETMHSALNL